MEKTLALLELAQNDQVKMFYEREKMGCRFNE
jgi:hypothetical protein